MIIYRMFRSIASSLIGIMQILLLVRAISSWFPQVAGSKMSEVLYMVTEPIIMPFRALMNKFPAMRQFPLDISFLLAFFSLQIIEMIL